MSNPRDPMGPESLTFGGPAVYRIIVQGSVPESYADRIADMRITKVSGGDSKAVQTTLVGRLRDQAELSGVLNTLYELHLSILKVQRLPCEQQDRKQ